ncbi:MAG TPA: hypothetical protein P5055_01585, partial [Candidatus Paceibacterota bacterium]|nr:hypothetical protein [Candidatus Paceibacterota bacterium]
MRQLILRWGPILFLARPMARVPSGSIIGRLLLAVCGIGLLAGIDGAPLKIQAAVADAKTPAAIPATLVTSTRPLRELVGQDTAGQCQVDLSGIVTYVSRQHRCLVLQDPEGAVRLELNPDRHAVSVGDQIKMEGICNFWQGRAVVDIVPLINHDGLHGASEQSARVYLPAGRSQIRVAYFEKTGDETLQFSYEGPGVSKQPVPPEVLFCTADSGHLQPGLKYQYYEGSWNEMPDFSQFIPVKTGVTPNIDLGQRASDDGFGFQFSGWIDL